MKSESDAKTALRRCLEGDSDIRNFFGPAEDEADTVQNCLNAAVLTAMGEASLARADGTGDRGIFRFLWLRSFHSPVSVRAERPDPPGTLAVTVLEGANALDPGPVQLRQERPLDEAEWLTLKRLADTAKLWTMPSEGADTGFDGADWILETARGNDHRMVRRWSPQEQGPDHGFRTICLYLLDLASLSFSAPEVY